MSADSTANSDASDPGSPFSHTSASTDDVSAQQSASSTKSTPNVSPQNGKTLKRQAQVTEKCDKKRVRKEIKSNGSVEIKIIPVVTPTKQNSTPIMQSTASKKSNLVKSTLSAITNLNVFKTQPTASVKTTIANAPPSLVIPTVSTAQQQQQPPNLAQLTTTQSTGAAAISKLTDYFKLKKDLNSMNMERYCNMIMSLHSGAKQVSKDKLPDSTVNKNLTTITPISSSQNTPKTPTKKVVSEKKTAKIAPIIPVARKSTNTSAPGNRSINSAWDRAQQNQKSIRSSPKKPVTIAPRIIEPKTTPTKNGIMQPKAVPINNIKAATNGKLVATSTASQQNQQQPTVLLAAIRIPSQQMQNNSQPPPLKMQNGLIQKTTTTTTTTTKLAPLLQFHTQQMIPNLIQLPNLIATNMNGNKHTIGTKQVPTSTTQTHPNLFVNSGGQLSHHQQQQQIFMNGAVIKLQPMSMSSQSSAQTAVTSTVSNMTNAINNANQKFAMNQQQQAFAAQLAQLQQMQQLFMTTPVLFNTSSIPTVLTPQLASLQHALNQQPICSMAPPSTIPALQPIQSSLLSSYSSNCMTTTTNSIQLPSISTLLHNHPSIAGTTQHFQNVQLQQQNVMPTLLKTSIAPSYTSLPPSLTITSGFVSNPNHQSKITSQIQHATVSPSQKAPPPLAPASNNALNISNLPKLISVSSSASQTSPTSPPPLVINQKVSLPHGSPIVIKTPILKQEINIGESKPNAICVVPPLPSPAKIKVEVEVEEKITYIEQKKDTKSAISIVIEEKSTIECAKSPILSQPKTIRFPPVNGKVTVWKKCIKISKTGVCNWEKCSKQFDSNSDLLDHLTQHHIDKQEGPFVCSWRDCKVNGREGSKGWLERHVMSHVGSKPFKCIVERCGMRFGNQTQLHKHVNSHFNSSDQQINSKRSSDPPAPKKAKKVEKKSKIRRQPWSARRFDFFDVGMMDVLQYRLEKAESIIHGRDIEVTFRGRIIGKRRSNDGDDEFQVTWNPSRIISDEWIKRPEDSYKSTFQLTKDVSVKKMVAPQRTALLEYVNSITSVHSRPSTVKKTRKFSSTRSSSHTSLTSAST